MRHLAKLSPRDGAAANARHLGQLELIPPTRTPECAQILTENIVQHVANVCDKIQVIKGFLMGVDCRLYPFVGSKKCSCIHYLTDVDIGEIIGRNLRHYRQSAGVTQWKLSEISGVSRPVIAKLELGRLPTPRTDTVVALAKALRVNVDDLLTEEPKSIAFQPLVERFLSSDLSKMLELTQGEIAWLRSFPTIEWLGNEPNDRTIYELISALRTTEESDRK